MTYEEIDALRLKAFKTNSEQNRNAYFNAASKWFQDEVYRRMDRERELSTLRAENERLREALIRDANRKLTDIVEWLNQDEDNATLLLSALTPEQLAAAKEALK